MKGERDTPPSWDDKGEFRVAGEAGRARVAAMAASDIAGSLGLARLAQHRFDALSLLMGHLLWTARPDGNADDIPSWRAYTGQSREEVRGLGWVRAVHPADQGRVVATWLGAVRSGNPYQAEYRLRRQNGEYRWFLARGAPVRDDDGAIVEWVSVCIDIDAQKRAEAKLEDAYRRTTSILESISDAYFAVDRAWRLTYFNTEAERLLLTARDRLLGRSLWEAMPEAVGTAFYAEFHRAVAENVPVTFEGFYPPLDTWFAVRAYPTRDGLSVYFQDVSPRRAVDQERQRLATRTRNALVALLEMAEQAVAAPPDARVPAGRRSRRPTSRAMSRLATFAAHVLGYERVRIHTLEGPDRILRPVAVAGLSIREQRRWWRRYTERDIPLSADYEPAVIARVSEGEVVPVDAAPGDTERAEDGGRYNAGQMIVAPLCVGTELVGILAAETAASPHRCTPAEIELIAGVARLLALVLGRERLVREREEARTRELAAVEANRRMDEFLSIAGHEMRTPITVVKTNTQLLARGTGASRRAAVNHGLTDAQVRMLARMEAAADRLNRLVADLLDVSRIREGKLQLDAHPCDVVDVVCDAVEEQRQTNPDRVILLESALDGPLVARADASRIAQVLVNYLTNALKYAPPEAPIRVRVDRLESGDDSGAGEARVAVRDEGPGLSPEQQRHLWERFYRVPGVEVQSGSGVGLGLGLYICREIVERHGGAVGVESAPGGGSTFWFTLPLAGDSAPI